MKQYEYIHQNPMCVHFAEHMLHIDTQTVDSRPTHVLHAPQFGQVPTLYLPSQMRMEIYYLKALVLGTQH
ncbi:hypothetical protein [Acinetobacter sp. BWR-L5]|uniref:hypothetical protein n=1 Tax=Acinetobacter sp. BWR-L5 TaxID=2815725 RepID=UPI0031FF01DC